MYILSHEYGVKHLNLIYFFVRIDNKCEDIEIPIQKVEFEEVCTDVTHKICTPKVVEVGIKFIFKILSLLYYHPKMRNWVKYNKHKNIF